jgi:hypothetical protein
VASVVQVINKKINPALATTYEGDDPDLLERVLPLVDYLEISPDAIARSDGKRSRLRPEVLREYEVASGAVRFIAHGVGLSIGSFDNWNEGYLGLLDELFSRLDIEWHSEHLAYTEVGGENLGTMLALPRTSEALDLVCKRVDVIQERYRVPFLLEHVIHILPDAPAEFTPAGFLNEITRRTGCGLILDAYNLECDAHNYGFDITKFLGELDLTRARELHVAGGVEQHGFQLDIHSRPSSESTLALGVSISTCAPGLRVVTYEFLKEAVASMTHETICAELLRTRQAFNNDPA